MDAFSIIVAGGLLLGLVAILALGYFYPGSGADVLDWRPTRSPEVEAQNEIDDIEQMLEAQNLRRRRRGLPDLTEEDIERRVAADKAEMIRSRPSNDARRAEVDARRRAKREARERAEAEARERAEAGEAAGPDARADDAPPPAG